MPVRDLDSLDDLTLLRAWQSSRDASAFQALAQRYAGYLYTIARRMLGNEADAQDVAQQCLVNLASHTGSINTSLAAWLHRVATRRAFDLLRSDLSRRHREQRYLEAIPTVNEAQWDDIQEQVDAAIEALSEDLRLAMIAHFIEGKTQEATASSLGITRRVAQYRIQKGVERVRAHLGKRGITVGAEALGVLLLANISLTSAHAAPVAVVAAAGKLALSGAESAKLMTGSAAAAAGTTGAIGMSKLLLGVVALVVAAAGAWVVLPERKADAPAKTSVAAAPIPQPAETPAQLVLEAPPAAVKEEEAAQAQQSVVQAAEEASEPTPPPPAPAAKKEVPLSPDQYPVVNGEVRDQEGIAVAGAEVVLRPLLSGTNGTVVSDGAEAGRTSAVGGMGGGSGFGGGGYEGGGFVQFGAGDQAQYYSASEKPHATTTYSVRSDAEGNFKFSPIPYVGPALLTAFAPEEKPGSELIALTPGGDARAVLKIGGEATPIHGRVLSSAGEGVGDAVVKVSGINYTQGTIKELSLSGGNSVSSHMGSGIADDAYTAADGHFTLWLDQGAESQQTSLSLQVDSPGQGRLTFANEPVSPEELLVLRYHRSATLSGTITLGDGAPAAAHVVRMTGAIVVDHGDGGGGMSDGSVENAQTGSDGHYAFNTVDTGQQYMLSIYSPEGRPLLKDHFEGNFAEGEDRQWNQTLEAPARITGIVIGTPHRKPLAGVRVHVQRPLDVPMMAAHDETTTDIEGKYSIDILSGQGTYSVFVQLVRHVFAGNQQQHALQVELQPGKEVRADLEVPEPCRLEFVLVDEAGQPVPGVGCSVQERQQGNGGGATATNMSEEETDAEGRAVFDQLAPGIEYTMTFMQQGYLTATSMPFTGAPGEAAPPEEIVLRGKAALAFTLVDAEGQPLANHPLNILLRYEDEDHEREVHSDGKGQVLLEELPATSVELSYTLSVATEDGGTIERHISGSVNLNQGLTLDIGYLGDSSLPEATYTEN